MAVPQDRGRAAEALAAAYLELLGYHVVARNVRLGGVEVDLVADDGPVRVIVEVRLRSHRDFGGAAASVDRHKQERLVRAAHALLQHGNDRVRIDVLALDRDPEGLRLTHHRNAIDG